MTKEDMAHHVSVNPLDQPNIEDNEYEAPDAILG